MIQITCPKSDVDVCSTVTCGQPGSWMYKQIFFCERMILEVPYDNTLIE